MPHALGILAVLHGDSQGGRGRGGIELAGPQLVQGPRPVQGFGDARWLEDLPVGPNAVDEPGDLLGQLAALGTLKEVARRGGNLFEALLDTAKVCSLGQISQALYEVGGQYRRNM